MAWCAFCCWGVATSRSSQAELEDKCALKIYMYMYACVCVCLCIHSQVYANAFMYFYIYFNPSIYPSITFITCTRVLVTQSCLTLCDPRDYSPQDPLSMWFSKQEYWSGLPFPPPAESSQPRDQTRVSCIAGKFSTIWATREAMHIESV